MYRRVLPSGIVIRSTLEQDAQQLESLQIKVFPTLEDSQRLKVPHYKKHLQIFPEGQFVAVDGDKVVGMTTTIRLTDDFLHRPHTFEDVVVGGFCTSHFDDGEWLYGVDMGTHPDYRGRGLARALYVARAELVKKYKLLGQYTMGMLNGYADIKDQMSVEEYYLKVVDGKMKDPTVSAQMKIGFEPGGLVLKYLSDPQCGDACVRLVLPASKLIADEESFYK